MNAQPPAAMAAGNVETSQRITDVMLGALAQAAPDRIPAASSGTMNNLSFGGGMRGADARSPTTKPSPAAWARRRMRDGASAIHTHMTNSWNTPVEAFEHQYPAAHRRYRMRRGSGGAGMHRGGDGIVREFEFLTRADVTILSDRRERGPYGLSGGKPGARGRNSLLRGQRGKSVQILAIPGKARFEVEAAGCTAHRVAGRRRIWKAEADTASRPEALRRVAMRQTWRRLTFLHWPYAPI